MFKQILTKFRHETMRIKRKFENDIRFCHLIGSIKEAISFRKIWVTWRRNRSNIRVLRKILCVIGNYQVYFWYRKDYTTIAIKEVDPELVILAVSKTIGVLPNVKVDAASIDLKFKNPQTGMRMSICIFYPSNCEINYEYEEIDVHEKKTIVRIKNTCIDKYLEKEEEIVNGK